MAEEMINKDYFKVITTLNKNDWSEFVYNHPNGNIFQTPEMRDVYERTKHYDPISLAVTDDTGEILALVQAVVIREMDGYLGLFSARSIIHGGPLFTNGNKGKMAVLFLMDKYNKIARKRALYSETRNIHGLSEFRSLFECAGYVFEDHLNYLVDLNRHEEDVWTSIHRSMRKNIKRSQKKGVRIREIVDKSQIKIFYEFLRDVYHHAKIPLADISHFKAVFDILVPKGMAKFHMAEHDGENIGGRVTLTYNGVIYAYSVGVPKMYKQLYPNALMNWEVMRWGAENGYHTFDFGGAGNPDKDYGVREFKRQFGGKLVNYGRYKKIHSPVMMKIAEVGFEVYRKVTL